ncbi:MAG: aminotransferase class III-fold pyridoxal phosphate-dependent enzyme [Planctomycetota bacterium]|jgi:4-aminobutyrate aminotransferase-like enzyme
MTQSDPAALAADHLAGNARIDEAVAAIVDELRTAQATLDGARPASAALAESYQQWIDRNATVRGRGAWYPYVGSGVGRGPLVELLDGSVKWDMIGGIGVHLFGHGDPELVEIAVRAGLSDLLMQGNLQYNGDSIEFAELLVAEAAKRSRLAHCFVSNSGCMVNESALKVCQQKTGGAPRIFAFAGCFMGRSTTMSQIGDNAAYRQGVPLNALVDYLPFFDPALGERSIEMARWHMEQQILRYPKQHSCLIVELVQGEGGFNTAPREFFLPIFELARAHGIPIWDDEVQTFGRTETMYAFERLDLGEFVDVLTLGKMSQACACLFTAEMNPGPGLLSGTFSASTAAFRVGRRLLERMRDGGHYGPDGGNARLHRAFREGIAAIQGRHPEWFPTVPLEFGRSTDEVVGGIGGMMRFTPFGGDKAKVMRLLHTMFEEGVIAFACGHGPYHVRFLPPVGVMRVEQFAPVMEIVERALARVAMEPAETA